MDLKLIEKAMNYAFEKHKNQKRKGFGNILENRPIYFVHLMDVASILLKNNASDKLVAAGFLHDIVEDSDETGVSEEMLRENFNKEIVDFVISVTEINKGNETREEKIKTWRKRKEKFICFLKNASKEEQMLVCADKLATIRDIISSYNLYGDKVFEILNSPSGKSDQKWYFQEVIDNLKDIKETLMYLELKKEFNQLFLE